MCLIENSKKCCHIRGFSRENTTVTFFKFANVPPPAWGHGRVSRAWHYATDVTTSPTIRESRAEEVRRDFEPRYASGCGPAATRTKVKVLNIINKARAGRVPIIYNNC